MVSRAKRKLRGVVSADPISEVVAPLSPAAVSAIPSARKRWPGLRRVNSPSSPARSGSLAWSTVSVASPAITNSKPIRPITRYQVSRLDSRGSLPSASSSSIPNSESSEPGVISSLRGRVGAVTPPVKCGTAGLTSGSVAFPGVATRKSCRAVHPFVDQVAQDRQRDEAGTEDDVVEVLDVELRAEAGLRRLAQSEDLPLADLVGQGLARPADVPVDLVLDVVGCLR